MKEVMEPPADTGEHETESPALEISESMPVQRDLISESSMDPAEWIEKYAAKFRELVESNSRLRNLIREDQELAKLEIKALLEEDSEIEGEKAA